MALGNAAMPSLDELLAQSKAQAGSSSGMPSAGREAGWRADAAALALVCLGSASSFALLPLLHQVLGVPHKYARKLTHMAAAHVSLLAAFVTDKPAIAAAPWAAFALVSATSLLVPATWVLQKVADALRKNRGGDGWTPVAYFSALAVISYAVTSGHVDTAAVALASLAWGDGLAGMTPYHGRKREVSLHCLVMCTATSVWVMVIQRLRSPPSVPWFGTQITLHAWIVGLMAALTELATGLLLPDRVGLPTASWENAAIPLAAATCHKVLKSQGY